MLTISIDDQQVVEMLEQMPKKAARSLELAIDKTARMVRDAVRAQITVVFDRPTPYTRNSLQLRLTQGHNFQATVGFKTPDRMGAHYLLPEVDGGPRQLKGFERALGGEQYFPTRLAAAAGLIDQYGNIPGSKIKQILSVLSRASGSGFDANITRRSQTRNRALRDFVWLSSPTNGLPAGIYERVAALPVVGKYSTISDRQRHKRPGFGAWEIGKDNALTRATRLRPILLLSTRPIIYRPRLPFYTLGRQVIGDHLIPQFWSQFFR